MRPIFLNFFRKPSLMGILDFEKSLNGVGHTSDQWISGLPGHGLTVLAPGTSEPSIAAVIVSCSGDYFCNSCSAAVITGSSFSFLLMVTLHASLRRGKNLLS